MTPFVRPPAPDWYRERFEAWRDRWLERGTWRWPTHEHVAVNVRLFEEAFRPMTANHCAYCDQTLGESSPETIDHFRPKGAFPAEAFDFGNLYPACALCQSFKAEQWHEALLRADDPGYDFDRSFVCDAATGELRPNPGASPEDRHRAERTIAILGLNRLGRPGGRRRAARAPADPDGPYRFVARLG